MAQQEIAGKIAEMPRSVRFRETDIANLPLLHYRYSGVNPIPVKPLRRAVRLPAGALRLAARGLDYELEVSPGGGLVVGRIDPAAT